MKYKEARASASLGRMVPAGATARHVPPRLLVTSTFAIASAAFCHSMWAGLGYDVRAVNVSVAKSLPVPIAVDPAAMVAIRHRLPLHTLGMSRMRLARLLAAAVLMWGLCGCAEIRNDRIIGDSPWQPGTIIAK